MRTPKIALLGLALGFLTLSCDKEVDEISIQSNSATQNAVALSKKLQTDEPITLKNPGGFNIISESLRDNVVVNNAVEPTECGPTPFVEVQTKYISELGKELVPVFGGEDANYLFKLFMDISFIAAYIDQTDPQYFGEKGEYTPLMDKRQRELERFWDMPNEIRVNGQHSAVLLDQDLIAYILYNYFSGLPSEKFAYEYAGWLVAIAEAMNTIPESPFFTADGFATSGKLIVIGDGIVKMLAETGIDQDIVWTGILAHEWAHQIQFDNYTAWYPKGTFGSTPEATRYTEMEADFLAAYYMTHKRGATYNWKRVEQFNQLYFAIGDCGFKSDGHHGTPDQRLAAARLGYELANSAHKQGHIMTPEQLHEYFVAHFETLI